MSFYNHNSPARSRVDRALMAFSLTLLACASSCALALDTGDILVASMKGEVHFVVNGADRTLRAGNPLELPATVRTGRDGAVELRQGATSISVGPDTLLEFPALAMPGGSIDRVVQPRGNAFYNIGKRQGRKLRVETPFLVGVVKGTQFNVASQAQATTISLFEGLLEVRAADDSDVVDLRAGEIARRDRSASDISVLKMDGKIPLAPKTPAGAGGNNATPTPSPPRPAPDSVTGESRFAERDNGSAPVTLTPDPVTQIAADVVVNTPAADVVVNTPAADVVVNTPAVDVVVNTPPADVVVNTPAADVVVNTPAIDVVVNTPAADVVVNTPAADVVVTTPAVDVVVNTPVADVANVDLGVGAAVDLTTPPVVTVDTDVVADVDLGLDEDDSSGKGNNGNANGIGNGNGYGNGNSNGHGNGNGVTVVESAIEVVAEVDDLLEGKLKKPSKK